MADPQRSWTRYWSGLGSPAITKASFRKLIRKLIISRSVAFLIERNFSTEGIYLHAGSGTTESDSHIRKLKRTFIALDFVLDPLKIARENANSYYCIAGNIRDLPFKDQSLDGIWNVGVHEHFTPADNRQIFQEYFRVLKSESRALIFWPGKFTPYMLLKNAAETAIRLFLRDFQFFPDEINKAKSKNHVASELQEAGFKIISVKLSWRDLFVFYTVVAAKP